MSYFVVRSTEDGITIQETESAVFCVVNAMEQPIFLDHIPEFDKGYFWKESEGAVVVIKGEIIVPKPGGKIVEYTFE